MSSIAQATHIYAIRARRTGFIKIGITSDPDRRLRQAQTDCPYEVQHIVCIECPRAYDVEQWMHKELRLWHVRGEWFWVLRDAHIHAVTRRAMRLLDRGDLPVAPLPWTRLPKLPHAAPQTDRPQVGPQELLTLYRLMRSAGITREDARPALKGVNVPLNNNLWTLAKPPEDAALTPIALRPTRAAFYEDDPELVYQPPN